jgi:hypothetical protein
MLLAVFVLFSITGCHQDNNENGFFVEKPLKQKDYYDIFVRHF